MNRLSIGCLWAWLLTIAPLLAEDFPNAGFESGSFDGWTVGGRKDAGAKVIPSGPVFEQLGQSRQFRSAGGWEGHPVAPLLDRSNNQHLLQISSDGYLNATTESTVTIEAGKQYAVSLIAQSRNGGEAIYYLDVYAIDKDRRLPLGTAQYTARSDELFRQTFTFAVEKDHPQIGKRIGLTARYRGRNLLDNAAIQIAPIRRSGAEAIARHLPLVETLAAEGKHTFIIRGYEDFR